MNNEWAITCRLSPVSPRLCFIVLISFALYSLLWTDSLITTVVFLIFSYQRSFKVHYMLQCLERWKGNLCQYSPSSHADVGAAKGSTRISPSAPDGQSDHVGMCAGTPSLWCDTQTKLVKQAGEEQKDGVTYWPLSEFDWRHLTWSSLCIRTWITSGGLKAISSTNVVW